MPPGIAIVVQGVVFHNISGIIHRIDIVFSARRSERGRLETEDAEPEWPLWRAEYSDFSGALAARQVSFDKDSLYAEVVGEIETENKVLVIKRITITLHLSADEEDREDVERVLEVYEDGCPVARSIRGSIEITCNLDLATRQVA